MEQDRLGARQERTSRGRTTRAGVGRRNAIAADAPPPRDCFSQSGLPCRFGRYQLLKLVARGGMGQVYLAATSGVEGAERPIIIKVIRREHAKDPNFLARFLDEARVQSQLQHSGVAQIIEAAIHEPTGDPFVAIEHVEGKSLGNVRRRLAEVGARLGWEDAVAIGTLTCEALAHIHERTDPAGKPLRIVHRDLSPHNAMVGYDGELKIIDFGTARAQNRRCHTVAGVVFAKPGYVAPEVANGDSGDFRVDLYAVGVMVWELCANRRFLQGDAREHMAAVAAGRRDLPPIAAAVGAPAALDRVIALLTATDRDARYRSTRQAATELGSLLRSASSLPNGERGARTRIQQLMARLYPSQPGRARREFERLVVDARALEPEEWRSPIDDDPAADPELLAGTSYRLIREIGRGAQSVVYEAEHVELCRRVALKVLAAEHTHSRDFTARFRREARTMSRMHHPNLVRVYDFGQTSDGRLFCAMELCEGVTLRAALDRGEIFGPRQVLRIGLHAALALAAAHRAGIVHRDVKPENLILTESGELKVCDFGLAKAEQELAEPDSDRRESLTGGPLGALTLLGTAEYVAPEQASGGRVDGRADVYALGCVLYELLSGQPPFVASSPALLLDQKLKGNPVSVRRQVPARSVPSAVDRVVMKALARHPSRRFASAEEMAEAIADALDQPTRIRSRRRAIGASLFAGLMGFGVVLLFGQLSPWLSRLPQRMHWLAPPAHKAPASRSEPAGARQPRPIALPVQVIAHR